MNAAVALDADLVHRLCFDVYAATDGAPVVQVVTDPLDDSLWVRLATCPAARDALTALNAHGLSGHDLEDGRLHVTGWDIRLLHRRLGTLLAGIDDLTTEWDATAELVCYHHDRRIAAGTDADPADVLADVETVMRSCVPIPRRAPRVSDIDTVLQLVAAAEDAYQQLIARHINYAEQVLAEHAATRRPEAAA